MTTFTKQLLSGSTNGKGVKVASASGSSATTVHTAVSGTTSIDEVWVWGVNSSTGDVKLSLCWGGTTDPDDLIEVTLPAEGGLVLIAPGLPLQNGLVLKAFAGSANVVLLHGFVNRIAP